MQIPLFLNDIAGSEIILILVFILMFFGSKSIPGIAKTMGRTFRQIKDASAELQNEIKSSGADIKKELNLNGIIEDTKRNIQQPLDQFAIDVENVVERKPMYSQSHIPNKIITPESVDLQDNPQINVDQQNLSENQSKE